MTFLFLTLTLLGGLSGCRDRGESDPRQSRSPETSGGESETSDRDPAGGQLAVTGTVPLEISAVVAGKSAQASGLGECRFEPNGSIYEKPAALWSVSYSDADNAGFQHLNLTVWRLKNGAAEQVSLALQVGETTHQISTVEGGELKGRGSVTAPQGGGGGRIRVEGEDAGGTQLAVTVDCPRFTGIEPAGG